MINIKDDAKKMADLLRSGYTMLNMACPACNNPIFRNKNGELFCPICNKKVLIVKNETNQESINNNEIKANAGEKVNSKNKDNTEILNSLKQVLIKKIDWVAQKLKKETQIDLIERYIKILLNLYDLLYKLTNLK